MFILNTKRWLKYMQILRYHSNMMLLQRNRSSKHLYSIPLCSTKVFSTPHSTWLGAFYSSSFYRINLLNFPLVIQFIRKSMCAFYSNIRRTKMGAIEQKTYSRFPRDGEFESPHFVSICVYIFKQIKFIRGWVQTNGDSEN